MAGRWQRLAVAACVAVLVGACGGDDGGGPLDGAGSPGAGAGEGDGDGGTTGRGDKEPAAELACDDGIRQRLPEGFDPATCWVVTGPIDPVVIGDRVFALLQDGEVPLDGITAPLVVAAYDAATGERVWASDPLPGPVHGLQPVAVEGEPGIAVLADEPDEGDAVTSPSVGWGYLAWPADVDVDADGATPVEPAVHVSEPTDETTLELTTVLWTDQGVLAGDRLLRPGADEFEPVVVDAEPMEVDDTYDLDKTVVGVAGEVVLAYVSDIAFPAAGPDDGNSYVGWRAHHLDGTTAWDAVTSFPNQGEVVISAEGPARLPIVVGDHVVTIAATDESYSDFTVAWLDAATGAEARPTPDDLAGATPTGGQADVIAGDIATLLSPDGRYLFAQWSTLALVVDVEAGTVARVASDFDIRGAAIDDSALYATTDNGSLTIDLATAEADPLPEGTLAVTDIADEVAAFTLDDHDYSTPDQLVVAHRRP